MAGADPQPLQHAVSAVIVNFNAGESLAAAVAAVASQVDEVVIVDNASSDDSLAICEQRCAEQTQLNIIRNAGNEGFARACNTGARLARHDRLLFLNPDCVVHAGAIGRLQQVLEAHDSTGMVGGLLLNPDGTEQAGARRAMPTPWRALVRAFGLTALAGRWPRLFADFNLYRQPLPELPVSVEAVSGALLMVKRAAMQAVGPWDEDYFLHCEDLDWCLRFRRQGWDVVFVPDARATHAAGTCGRDRRLFVEWHKHAGMRRFHRKFYRQEAGLLLTGCVAAGIWLHLLVVALRIGLDRVMAR